MNYLIGFLFLLLSVTKFIFSIEIQDSIVRPIIMFENSSINRIIIKISLNTPPNIIITVKPLTINFSKNIHLLNNKCLLNGEILIESYSRGKAIVSVCDDNHHLFGILEVDGKTYSISPQNINYRNRIKSKSLKLRSKRSLKKHLIIKIEHFDDGDKQDFACGNTFRDPRPKDYQEYINKRLEEVEDDPNINFGEAVVEVAVYIDQVLYRHTFKKDMSSIARYLTINFAYLQKQLMQRNLEKHIRIKVVISHFGVAPFHETHQWDDGHYLEQFCKWRKNGVKADVSIIFTGSNIWTRSKKDNKIRTGRMGLAYSETLCNHNSACVILEGREGFASLHLLVHEFGHILGSRHDGEMMYSTEDCSAHKFIMSYGVSNGKNTWSECSVKAIRKYLLQLERSNKTNRILCLSNEAKLFSPEFDITNVDARQPGRKIDVDQQCKMAFGTRYSAYSKDNPNVCLQMECQNDFYVIKTWGALEGTKCGDNRSCDRDVCKRRSD